MKTDTMRTWPIAVRTQNGCALVGIPACLGDGRLYRAETFASFPCMDEIAGDDWLTQVLSALLPEYRPWAWWSRSEIIAKAGLRGPAAPSVLNIARLDQTLVKRLYFRGMSLAVIPGQRTDQQALLKEWAGVDTEHAPELIWTAPEGLETWDIQFVLKWSRNRKLWQDPLPLLGRHTERLVMLFDGDIYCALSAEASESVLRRIGSVAAGWGLELIPGPQEYAWVAGPIVTAPASAR